MGSASPLTPDARLAAAIEEIARELGSPMAVALRHLPSRRALDYRADEIFPAASAIKTAILVALYRAVAAGDVSLDERIRLREEDKVPGSGALKEIHAGAEFTLEDLARLMIVISDNTASNLIIDRLGVPRLEQEFAALGLQRTRLRRRFFDMEARARGIENEITAGELADLYVRLERREAAPPDACEAMLAILRRQQFDSKLPRLLPPDTPIAHKTGTISDASHDGGIVYTPTGPLVVVVLTKQVTDHAFAEGAIRHVARLAYETWGVSSPDGRDRQCAP